MTEELLTSEDTQSSTGMRTITMAFQPKKTNRVRRRKERQKRLRKKHPGTIARLLAMAHMIQEQLDAGKFRDYRDVAETHELSRARITQVMNLLLLSPSIQEEVINFKVYPGREPITEHHLRQVLRSMIWSEQEEVWKGVLRSQGIIMDTE